MSASVPIFLNRPRISHCAPCRSRAEKRFRVATICLLLKFQATFERWLEGPRECLLKFTSRAGTHAPRPARQTVLLVKRKDHVDRGVDFDRLAIEKSRLIAPLANGVQRRLLQER